MFTLTGALRAPAALQRRTAFRRAQRGRSKGAGGGVRAVLKNGGFRNGDAARRRDDERAGDEPPRHSSRDRSFYGSSIATDSARAETPGTRAFRSDEKSAPRFGAVPDDPSSEADPSADEVSFFPEYAEAAEDAEDDIPLYRALAHGSSRAPSRREPSVPDTVPDTVPDAPPQPRAPSDPRAPPSPQKEGGSRWPALADTAAEFDEASAMRRGAIAALMAPPWRVMLLSDGSVTRHLTLLTDAKVRVDVLAQRLVGPGAVAADPSAPADVVDVLTRDGAYFRGRDGSRTSETRNGVSSRVAKVVHREVDLCDGASGAPLVYASSWWTEEAATAYGIVDQTTGGATSRPVWSHLSDAKTELYREVRRVYLGSAPALEAAWNVRGPFWARHYIFWAGAQPLCVIYEVFSPELEKFLGARTAGTGAEDTI